MANQTQKNDARQNWSPSGVWHGEAGKRRWVEGYSLSPVFPQRSPGHTFEQLSGCHGPSMGKAWEPTVPHSSTQMTSGEREEEACCRGEGMGSRLSAKFVIFTCILVRICTLMPHLLRKSTRDFRGFEVMIRLMFSFPPSCRAGPGFYEKSQ